MVPIRGRSFALRALISIAVSVVILAFLFHLVQSQPDDPGVKPVMEVLGAVLWPVAALYVLTQIGQTWLRALRYRLFLRAEGTDRLPSRGFIFLVTLVRNMLVDLVPARIGELSYVVMLNRGYRVPATACFSSLGLSIVFDVLALVAVVALLLAVSFQDLAVSLRMPAVIGAVLVALGLGVYYGAEILAGVLRRAGARLTMKWWRRLMDFGARTFESVHRIRQARVLWQVLAYSLGIRLFKYGGLYLLFLVVAWRSFPDLAAVPLWQVVTAFIGAEASASLPVPAFMSFGTYEAGGLAALTLFGFAPAVSLTVMFAVHLLSQIADYLFGAAGMVGFTFAAGRRQDKT